MADAERRPVNWGAIVGAMQGEHGPRRDHARFEAVEDIVSMARRSPRLAPLTFLSLRPRFLDDLSCYGYWIVFLAFPACWICTHFFFLPSTANTRNGVTNPRM